MVAVGLVAVLAVSPAYAPPPFDPPGLDRAIAVQEYHTNSLMAVPGVVGTAVGLGADGQPVVKIYTESTGVPGLPRSLDGVPVVVQVTGRIFALGHCAEHTGGKPPPGCGGGENGGNNAPTADDKSVTTEQDTPVTITLSGSDEETCDLTFSIDSGPSNGILSSITDQTCNGGTPNTVTAQVTYTPATDFNGTDSFGYTVNDGDAISNVATVTITVGQLFERPAHIGTSSGPERLIRVNRQLFCIGGTYGVRVTDGTNVYALSNAHIYALVGTRSVGKVRVGDRILNPSRADLPGCGAPEEIDAAEIANLSAWVPIDFSLVASNTVDAAIAVSEEQLIGTDTPSAGYGTPNSATQVVIAEDLPLGVTKYGATTSETFGVINDINATVFVEYDSGIAVFVGQIVIDGVGFSQGGDSGSLIVTVDGSNSPVGLLFAGSGSVTIANPIDLVLSELAAELGLTAGTLEIDGAP